MSFFQAFLAPAEFQARSARNGTDRDAHAAVAEGPLVLLEQRSLRRVVQIDRKLVRELNLMRPSALPAPGGCVTLSCAVVVPLHSRPIRAKMLGSRP